MLLWLIKQNYFKHVLLRFKQIICLILKVFYRIIVLKVVYILKGNCGIINNFLNQFKEY